MYVYTYNVASFLHCQAKSFTIMSISSQQQSGSNDCGLYAIAAATSLCHGEAPNAVIWEMRGHLLRCFKSGKLTPFPGWYLKDDAIMFGQEPIVSEKKIAVYCSCRMPADRKKMAQWIQCLEWYHQPCQNISAAVFKKFTCSLCV